MTALTLISLWLNQKVYPGGPPQGRFAWVDLCNMLI